MPANGRAEQFRQYGITYRPADRPKSDLYRDVLALLNSGRVELLDHPKLAAQFLGLERRTVRGGRDSIDHASGAHDDLANSVAGVLVQLAGGLTFPGQGIFEYYRLQAEKLRRQEDERFNPPPTVTVYAKGSVEWARQQAQNRQ